MKTRIARIFLILVIVCLATSVFVACGEPDGDTTPPTHTHNYATLKYDENNHWFECDCGDKNNVEVHSGGTATETERAVCTVCNQAYGTTLYVREGDYIYFGSYPQTLKSESVTIDESTQTLDGYYLGSDGALYAKVVADPCYDGYTFSTGESVVEGITYYFKVEPIKWRILSEGGGEALILCESIIANKAYDTYDYNYANSDVRAWLNAEFYNTAFTTLQQSLIKTTEVDNSASTTGSSTNPYACENTFDKVFLMSYQEMLNPDYGFSTSSSTYDTARRRQTTDYSGATGAWMYPDTSYYGNGDWWLRSPYAYYGYNASFVDYRGYVNNYIHVYCVNIGVVPALNIQLGNMSPEHTHNYLTQKYDENNHWYECSCGDKSNVEVHSGGTATETDRAVCTVCNQAYGSTLEGVSEYTVTLNVNGGNALSQNTQKVTYDTEFTLPTPTKENFEFVGWYYGNTQITDKTGKSLSEYFFAKDIVLTAKWETIFEVSNGTITGLTEYGKTLEEIVIPEKIDGVDIVAIGDKAFYEYDSLMSITIPNSVTNIGDSAFYNCTSLTSITIPNSVVSIGYNPFFGCTSLTYNVKGGLKYLGNEEKPYLYLVGVENQDITTVDNIDEKCRFIGFNAFSGCDSLTSVTIPDSVTSIGEWAFGWCDSLTSITIPKSVTSIGEGAFSSCYSLTIYCEAESKPSGWDSDWNYSDRPVVWGYKGE